MHLGHAVSKDMVEEELDIALYPDELGQIFSGSAVVDWRTQQDSFQISLDLLQSSLTIVQSKW